jgi:dihydropteroate synthase
MTDADAPERGLSRLEQAIAGAGPEARVYLLPLALMAGGAAEALMAERLACRIGAGPVAMTACAVRVRGAKGPVHEVAVAVHDLLAWASSAPAAAARIRVLLERIAAPRPGWDDRPRLMGIVNVTPDSFSDGGAHLDPAAALAHCEALVAAGADILDIGGESTRPGAAPVPPEEEIGRVLPVLEGLRARRDQLPGVLLSIDTRRAAVMRAAVQAGVDIINDVSALAGDPDSLAVAAASGAHVAIMHMQGTPETMNVAPAYDDVALDVFDFLEARIEACVAAGIARERITVDPGLGFGKRGRQNLEILRALPLFHGLGCPILLGASRKGFGSGQSALPPKERLPTSLAAAVHALFCGVQILRVHDVAETRQVVQLWRSLARRD